METVTEHDASIISIADGRLIPINNLKRFKYLDILGLQSLFI